MNNHEHERGVFMRDRENNILQMIADYYEENKSLKEEVEYLQKDNADYMADVEIYKNKINILRNALGVILHHVEDAQDPDRLAIYEDELVKMELVIKSALENGKI